MIMGYRLQFKFWLNVDKDDEAEIADTIELLKNRRLYTRAVRDGIRLFWDLWHGRLDLLLDLFPFVREKILQEALAQYAITPHMQRLDFQPTRISMREIDDDINLEEKEEAVDSATITKNLNQSLLSMFS
jgi:hypothetical protein